MSKSGDWHAAAGRSCDFISGGNSDAAFSSCRIQMVHHPSSQQSGANCRAFAPLLRPVCAIFSNQAAGIVGVMSKLLLLLISVVLGYGCSSDKDIQPVPGSDAEIVRLVVYFSDGDFDGKSVGEWALVDTGEALQVKRNQIRPIPALIVSDWSQYERLRASPPQPGHIEMRLDRVKGIACLPDRCAYLYAICPPRSKILAGEKCKTFDAR